MISPLSDECKDFLEVCGRTGGNQKLISYVQRHYLPSLRVPQVVHLVAQRIAGAIRKVFRYAKAADPTQASHPAVNQRLSDDPWAVVDDLKRPADLTDWVQAHPPAESADGRP